MTDADFEQIEDRLASVLCGLATVDELIESIQDALARAWTEGWKANASKGEPA